MKVQKYGLNEVIEDIAKFGYSIYLFASKYFYQVSNIEALKNSMDAYMLSRFSQRFEYFLYEHEKLTIEEKKDFYNDLKNNHQNKNYLYSFIENLRITSFELNALILARLSREFIKKKNLNYYESTLLTNINIFNHTDWEVTYENLKNIFNDTLYSHSVVEQTSKKSFKINSYEDISTFNKLIQIGIIIDIKEFDGYSTAYASNFLDKDKLLEFKLFYCSHITEDFYYILKDVMENIK